MKKLLYCCLVAVATVSCASKQAQETVLHLKTDQAEAEIVNLDPLSYWDMYQYATDTINGKQEATLTCTLPCPLLAEVKVKKKKILQDIPVYLTPSANLEIMLEGEQYDKNKKTAFKGDLAKENTDLQIIYPTLRKLDKPNPKADSLRRSLEVWFEGKSYDSNFKEDILKAADMRIRTNRANESGKAEDLQALVQDLKSSKDWLLLNTWTREMDEIFKLAEQQGVLPKDEGITGRLAMIEDELIRSRYGVYALDAYAASRIWFGEDPYQVIEKTRPYITLDDAQKEIADIIKYAEKVSNDPKWKRSLEQPATDFCFEGLDGKMVSLSDYRGHFVIVDIWNVFCGVCIKQAPHMQRLEPELAKMDVHVIGVSTDDESLKDKWKATIKEKGIPGTQVIMGNSKDRGAFFKNYYMPHYPVYCLIDPEGNILHAYLPLPETPDFMATVKEKVEAYHSGKKKSDIPA